MEDLQNILDSGECVDQKGAKLTVSYYAFNCIMRWRAKRLSGFYVSRNEEDRALSAADIAAMVSDPAKQLAARVRRSAATLTGTPPYWAQQSRNLGAMIRQLGTPHAFITFSAADLQWPDLHAYMPVQAQPTATEAERQRINAKNVNENPAIAACWFYRRFELFFAKVLKPLLGVEDWWYRFEWQNRGSSHVHGLVWLKHAPSPDTLDLNNPESVQEFLDFWSTRVSTINPGEHIPPHPKHPSAHSSQEITFHFKDLAQLLNRVQRHTKCTAYCLRRPKGSPPDTPLVCRFKFPKELGTDLRLVVNPNGNKQLITPRNDTHLNSYNPVTALGWRANSDISPCTDPRAVATYISKYASKSEKPSSNFGEIMQAISTRLEQETSSRIVFQKMLSRIVTERDYSAQEVCHQLFGRHMMAASREFGTLCLLERRQRRLRQRQEDEGLEQGVEEQDWHDAYFARQPEHENISLYEWFQFYRKRGRSATRRKHAKIIILWPLYYPSDPQSEDHQHWCRAKLLLHHPHRHPSELKHDGESWLDAFARCVEDHPEGHQDTLPVRPVRQRQDGNDSDGDSEFSEGEEANDHELDDWQVLAGMGPQFDEDGWSGPMLGARDIDISHDWEAAGREWGADGIQERASFLESERKKVSSGLHSA